MSKPLNADDKLQERVQDICDRVGAGLLPPTGAGAIMQLILADRKKHELQARIEENSMYIKEVTRHYFPSGPSEPHIPLVQFHERIAELKQELEKP